MMGIQREAVITEFNFCPTVVCLGGSNMGKSLSASKGLEIISPNASSVLEFEHITAADLRNIVFTQLNIPVVLHDPDSPEVIEVLVKETYDDKTSCYCGNRIVPCCSAIITCNYDFFVAFRKKAT